MQDNKPVRIHRNWANQRDPKSDLVCVSHLTPTETRDFIQHLLLNEHHFHYFADHGGKSNRIKVSESAYKTWR